MRNLPPTPTLSAHPEIVLAGAHGGEVTTAVLQRGGKALGSMTTAGRKVFWPADKPALTAGDDYSVHLATADGKRAVEFKFAVAGDAGKAPVILRVD